MIRIILISILLIISSKASSQKIAVTYYDSALLLTIKEFGQFYRVGIIDTNRYQYYGEVKDYYMNGKLQMKGKFRANIKIDTFYFYYPSGKLITKGAYQNNLRHGIWINYHENGTIKDKVIFKGDFICAIESITENGVQKMTNGTGDWEITYYNDLNELITEEITLKGSFKDSLRHGVWNFYKKNVMIGPERVSNPKRLECTEEYDKGRFVKGKYYWEGVGVQEIGRPIKEVLPETRKFTNLETWKASKYASIESYPFLKFLPKVDSTVFPVDKKAEFPGGIDSLTKVLTKNTKFSKSYILSQKSRIVWFNILIDESGELKIMVDHNKTIASSPGNQVFHEQILKTISKLPNWTPATRGSKYVKNYFVMSIHMDNGSINVHLTSVN